MKRTQADPVANGIADRVGFAQQTGWGIPEPGADHHDRRQRGQPWEAGVGAFGCGGRWGGEGLTTHAVIIHATHSDGDFLNFFLHSLTCLYPPAIIRVTVLDSSI